MLIVRCGAVASEPSSAIAASSEAYSRALETTMFLCLSTHRRVPTKQRPSRVVVRIVAPMYFSRNEDEDGDEDAGGIITERQSEANAAVDLHAS